MKARTLRNLMWAVDSNARVSKWEIARTFGAFFGSNPDADLHELESHFRSGPNKALATSAFLRLVNAWNEMTGNKVDISPFIEPMRAQYLESVARMERLIKNSARLHEVFKPEWFAGLRRDLHDWSVIEEFTTTKYGAFISFLQFGDDDTTSVLREIDKAFLSVSAATRAKLSGKLEDMTRGLDHYVSTLFEIIVLSKFPQIIDYEPAISSGCPEARIQLVDQRVLIEARATRDMPLVSGFFVPEDVGGKLALKAKEKYSGQLSGAKEPVILFLAMNVGVNPLQVDAMLDFIGEDSDSSVLSAIVYSETCHARKFQLWIHPNPDFPLSTAAIEELKRLFAVS